MKKIIGLYLALFTVMIIILISSLWTQGYIFDFIQEVSLYRRELLLACYAIISISIIYFIVYKSM